MHTAMPSTISPPFSLNHHCVGGLHRYSAIDWRMGVGLLGHSMGAHATVQSAGMRPASPVAIKAAMAFAPQYFPPGEPSFADKVGGEGEGHANLSVARVVVVVSVGRCGSGHLCVQCLCVCARALLCV